MLLVTSSSATHKLMASREVKRPIGVVKVPAGWIAPRRLDQRLIVPNPDAINLCQIGRHFAQPIINHQPAHAVVVVPES